MTEIGSDIIDRRQVLAALRNTQDKYRTLFDSIDAGFCTVEVLFDAQGKAYDYRFLETNPAFERQTGFKNVSGKTMRSLAPDHEEHWFEIYGRIVITGEAIRFEQEAAALGKFYDVYAFRVGEPGENRVAVLFNDVSPRKRAEAALRESEERQKFLLKLADTLRPLADALEVQDRATRMLSEHLRAANVYYYETLPDEDELQVGRGYSADGAIWPERLRVSDYGESLLSAFRRGETIAFGDVEKDARVDPSSLAAFRAIGARASVGVPLLKDGSLAGSLGVHQPAPREWTQADLQLIEEVAERTWAAVGRARAEAALREREEKYRTLFDAIDEGFNLIEVLFDEQNRATDCRILEINPAYQRNTGLPPSVVGLRLKEFLPGFEQRIIDTYGEVALTGRSVRFEEYVSGLERWFDCYAFRVGGEGSRTVAVVFNNVTEKKLAAERLREADRRKSEFLAMLGHELRNPLAAVEGGLKLLQSPRARPESRATTLPIVAQQVAHMKRLIDDVLDLARLDRGKLQVQAVEVDLGEALLASIRMTESLAQAKGSPIRYQPPEAPIRLHADLERLVQVFANLLTNALKFSSEGSPVEIWAERGATAVVFVRDFGRGIAAENLLEIFEPFVQSKLSLGLPDAGLGLGLSVSRELVELHGGTITAHSAGLDQGSTFVVSLPLFSPL